MAVTRLAATAAADLQPKFSRLKSHTWVEFRRMPCPLWLLRFKSAKILPGPSRRSSSWGVSILTVNDQACWLELRRERVERRAEVVRFPLAPR